MSHPHKAEVVAKRPEKIYQLVLDPPYGTTFTFWTQTGVLLKTPASKAREVVDWLQGMVDTFRMNVNGLDGGQEQEEFWRHKAQQLLDMQAGRTPKELPPAEVVEAPAGDTIRVQRTLDDEDDDDLNANDPASPGFQPL
jgi:hypothetical protein